jgi:hypothetical protein
VNKIESPERSVWVPPRRRWRKRLLSSLIVVMVGLVILGIPILYFVFSADRTLREALAEADRLDPGWRAADLDARQAVIADEENSALVLLAANSLLPGNWPFWAYPQAVPPGERPKLTALRKELHFLEPPVLLDEALTNALRQELGRARDSLATLRKMMNLPKGRYPSSVSPRGTIDYYPISKNLRTVTLLAYETLLRAQEKDGDGAIISCRGLLNCDRSTGDLASHPYRLFRLALNQMATRMLERALAQGEASEKALSSIQHELEEEAEQPSLLQALRGQRAVTDEWMQEIQNGDSDPIGFVPPGRNWDYMDLMRIPSVTKRIRAAVLMCFNQYVEMAKLPVEQQLQRSKELQEAEQRLPELARYYLRSFRIHRDQAELRCAVVMVALERYRQAKNRWPEALTDLVPSFLPSLPLDPFDGFPLRYRRSDDGVVIYSVGPDGKDDGGNLEGPLEPSELMFGFGRPTEKGTDFGFRLWDVLKRRQLPKPYAGSLPHGPRYTRRQIALIRKCHLAGLAGSTLAKGGSPPYALVL